MSQTAWTKLQRDIEACGNCPRLRRHCQNVAAEKRRAYRHLKYWGKPVRNFGSANARLLIVGLAPAAHGANRTGRMFTGDRSGDWLFRALCKAGFASLPESLHRRDGLRLIDCAITAICHCAPPDNKPNRQELENCRPFLRRTMDLSRPRVIVALGGLAWNATLDLLVATEKMEQIRPRPKFSHGASVQVSRDCDLLGSYHPSQQNTFTGRLTEPMFDQIFQRTNRLLRDTKPR